MVHKRHPTKLPKDLSPGRRPLLGWQGRCLTCGWLTSIDPRHDVLDWLDEHLRVHEDHTISIGGVYGSRAKDP